MKKGNVSTDPPAEFLARMRNLLDPVEYDAFLSAFSNPPRAGLRVNTLKISIRDFISIAPFSLAPVGDWEPAGFFVMDESRPGRHPFHDAGLYYLQEPSAMVAAALLGAAPGEMILDLAAAPGGKSTHLASLMADPAAGPVSPLRRALDADGLLVANDVHAGRARLLANNLARWGATNVLVTQAEPARLAEAFGPRFDRVLIDAPCSGEGMIRRGESIEWSPAIVAACARRQGDILDVAPDLVRPGGQLLYSTCTFAPEENEQVVAGFLTHRPEFALEEMPIHEGFAHGRPEWSAAPPDVAGQLARAVRLWPHRFPGEGHFLAAMQRRPGNSTEQNERAVFRIHPPSADELRLWREFADSMLAVTLPAERLHAAGGRLYLLPKTAPATGRARIVRYGLLLGEARPGRFHPAHELALALNSSDMLSTMELPAGDGRLADFQAGADMPESGPDGWVLVAVEGFGLGWGKRVGGRVKNHYPHHLRRRS